MTEAITRIWKPHKRQEQFLSLPDTIFEALYGGAAGGGKSELILMIPIAREFYKIPRFKGLIMRRTYPELESEIIVRSQQIYPLAGGEYNQTKRRWTFPSGAIMAFGHCENEADIRTYDTAEYQYFAPDELTSFTEFQYLYMISRLRSSIPNLTPIIRTASNPGGVGHSWVRARFVEPAREGNVVILDKKTSQKRIFIQAKVTDNPTLMENDPGYINRLRSLPDAEKKAKLDGDWWTFSGQFFTQFRKEPFPDEPENAKHVMQPFEIPNWWPRVMCIDWGFAAMTICGKYAISPWKWVVKYSEQTWYETDIAIWAADIARSCQHEKFIDVVIDPSARQKRGDKSILEQFCAHAGFAARLGDNDRVSGAQLLREYLRWKPKPPSFIPPEGYKDSLYDEISRRHGFTAAENYKKMFEPEEPEINLPKLRFFNTCTETIEVIPNCVFAINNSEDVAEFSGDDPYDETRYAIKAIDNFLNTGSEIAKKLFATQAILDRLQKTGDQTTFYRQMEIFEGKKNNLGLTGTTKKAKFGVQRKAFGRR